VTNGDTRTIQPPWRPVRRPGRVPRPAAALVGTALFVLLAASLPGLARAAAGASEPGVAPAGLVNAAGTLFFSGHDADHGRELWKAEQTPDGWVASMVRDIRVGATGSGPRALRAIGAEVYFSANDGEHGRELWRSDGTKAGTVLVADVRPAGGNDITIFGEANGRVFFLSRTEDMGTNLPELYSTEGPGGPTVRLTGAGRPITSWGYAAVLGDELLFTGHDAVGTEDVLQVWATDGTTQGTRQVSHVDSGPGGGCNTITGYSRPLAGEVFFLVHVYCGGAVHAQIWKTDGTSEGTVLVKAIPGEGESFARNLTPAGQTMFFEVTDDAGAELWKTDGTEQGTEIVRVVDPGGRWNPSAAAPVAVGDGIFFIAVDATHGKEVWVSDGTEGGTHLTRDLYAPGSSFPASMVASGGGVLFSARDQQHRTELFRSLGTAATTELVADINPTAGRGSNPTGLTNVAGTVFFAANDGVHGRELWKSDGEPGHASMVTDL
jgi:ELWxxDGT repeat protein